MKKIFGIKIKHLLDENPDTSCLGEYTDKAEDGVIVRAENEYLEKLGEDYELPSKGNEFRFFKPYAGGEKVGTKEYYKYGMRDYERIEGLNNGNWCYIGINAVASVGVSFDGGKNWKLDTLTSRGLWGIESDSDKAYFAEVAQEELAELKNILLAYGFTKRQTENALKNVETEAY